MVLRWKVREARNDEEGVRTRRTISEYRLKRKERREKKKQTRPKT